MERENVRAEESDGRLEVVCGPMFSGKSEELIRRLRRAKIAKLSVMSFKPMIDNRYDPLSIASHSNQGISATPVASANELYMCVTGAAWLPDIIGIDEVQFLDPDIVEYVKEFVTKGVRVVIAGLDRDYRGEPFGVMPTLLALADKVLKLSAVCMSCGAPANHTYRLTESTELVQVGATGMYEARCRQCWVY